MTPADLAFHSTLQGGEPPSSEPAPEPAVGQVEPDGADEPALEAEVPPTFPAATTASSRPAPAVTDGWSVQVGAYRSRENADTQVKQLVAKGYAAAAVAPSAAGGYYRVRIGPFAQRAEAERTSARLKSEGIGSSVTR
jgi:cell division protein FtsN